MHTSYSVPEFFPRHGVCQFSWTH